MLKLGCFGCLTIALTCTVVGLAGWGILQASQVPEIVGLPTSEADGVRAQQKIFDLLRRSGTGRPHTVTLTEQELSSFLARHLDQVGEVPVRRLAARLPNDGHAEITGQIPFRELIAVWPLSTIATLVPMAWLERGAWLRLDTRVTIERTEGGRGRHRLRLDIERFWLGRLRLPELMLRVLLDPAALRLLRWPMPDAIDGLRIEPGRLVIQSAS